ncbi:MAG TPA: hypothetical protein V6C72_09385, partial [Chroococcales cyanobacterium]
LPQELLEHLQKAGISIEEFISKLGQEGDMSPEEFLTHVTADHIVPPTIAAPEELLKHLGEVEQFPEVNVTGEAHEKGSNGQAGKDGEADSTAKEAGANGQAGAKKEGAASESDATK